MPHGSLGDITEWRYDHIVVTNYSHVVIQAETRTKRLLFFTIPTVHYFNILTRFQHGSSSGKKLALVATACIEDSGPLILLQVRTSYSYTC